MMPLQHTNQSFYGMIAWFLAYHYSRVNVAQGEICMSYAHAIGWPHL